MNRLNFLTKITLLQSQVQLAITVVFAMLTFLFLYIGQRFIDQSLTRFEADTDKVRLVIDDEVSKYVYGLQGAKGVILLSNNSKRRQDFRKYAETRDFFSNFEGSLGFGFIRSVPEKDFPTYQIKNKKFFKVKPLTDQNNHMVIEIIEPVENNLAAVGLDIAFEAKRRSAAEYAARTGLPSLTDRIALVQQKAAHTGFLYLLPIYETALTPLTETDRIKKNKGWAYTPIVLEKVLEKIFPKIPQNVNIQIHFEDNLDPVIFGENVKEKFLITNKFQFKISFGSSTWTVEVTHSIASLIKNLISLLILYFITAVLFVLISFKILKKIKSKEQLFTESKMWLESIIESATHSIIATEKDGTILTFNTAAEALLGYKAEELVGKFTPSVIHDKEEVIARAQVLSHELGHEIEPGFEVFVARAKLGISDTNEWTYISKQGRRIPVRLSVSAICLPDNQLIGFLGIAENLTEIKKMSAVIDNQRAKMIEESKMALLGEMASGVAHEINTPLAVIIGKCEVMLKTLSSSTYPAEFNLNLQKIIATAERIAKIVRGLRLFSRRGDNDPVELVSVAELINLSIDLCSEKLHLAQIKVKTDIEENLKLIARPTEISQVLVNLLSNSRDALENLAEKWIHIKAYQVDHQICIEVRDSGPGIDEAIRTKMMNPFFTTKDVGKGTGLGLSISKGIIESSGGKFFYESKENHTCFFIYLPAEQNLAAYNVK